MKKLEEYVVSIPDYPEKGIIFRDVTSILEDPEGLQLSIRELQPIAYNLHKPFVPIRKKGKLPCETASIKYDLEYGSAEIEIHKRSIKPGDKVVIVDDLMATGGTAEAMIKLIEGLGGEGVEVLCLIELMGLKGREKLKGYKVDSVIQYPGN